MTKPLPLLFAICAMFALSVERAQAGDIGAGEQRYNVNCVNCHGRGGKGMASFPPILGRDADYIAHRLTQYRGRESVGPNSAIMMSLVADLTDEEIANLAVYISTTFQ